jgi:RimJ/RimL family protein N-acetyltransferase
MHKRCAWALGFLLLFCVVAIAILFREDVVQIPTAKIQRDLELKAHRELIQSIREDDRRLSAFTTDGCSGGLSKAWQTVSDRFPAFAKAHDKTPPWEHCCITHDRSYHSAGGATEARESYVLRLSADQALRKCVLDTGNKRSANLSAKYGLTEEQIHVAYEAIANAMFDAVRIGGLPCSGLAWRWGYGYPRCPRTTAPR